MEQKREVFKTADVVLLIISNEGELVDDIEYPVEFRRAYKFLEKLDIVKSHEGKFVPSKNFESALKNGVERYKENQLLEKVVLRKQKFQQRNFGVAIVSSLAVVVAGYLYRKQRKIHRDHV